MVCSTCGLDLSEERFAWRRKGVRHKMCRDCKRSYNQEWYKNNKQGHRQRCVDNKKRYDAKVLDLLNGLKNVPCADCSRRYRPYIMDFDHVRGTKLGNISDMAKNQVSKQRLLDEVAKCDVVCSNCHRERTHKRRGKDTKRVF
jgi:hypothetical protein